MRLLLLFALCAAAQTPDEVERELVKVRRIYIEKLTGGEAAAQMRDMLMASLQAARVFVVTENLERADAIMRGSAEDLVFTELFQSGERVDARASLSGRSGSTRTGVQGAGASIGVGLDESTRIQERKHEAM